MQNWLSRKSCSFVVRNDFQCYTGDFLVYWGPLHTSTSKLWFRFISGGTVAIPESQEVEKTLFTGVSTFNYQLSSLSLCLLFCNLSTIYLGHNNISESDSLRPG